MKNQKGFALAVVLVVLLLVTTISIPLILSSGSTNRQINKVEEINENITEIDIILDLVVAKYRQLSLDAITNNQSWSDFQLTLDSKITTFITNDVNYESSRISIDIIKHTYSGNTELISREVVVTSGNYIVKQKVNFRNASTGSTDFELLGLTAVEDIRTDGYIDLNFDLAAGDDFDLFNFGDFNINNMLKVNNYSNNTRFMYSNEEVVDYDDLSASNKQLVASKVNFFDSDIPDLLDMREILFYRILTEYSQDYQGIIDSGISESQIFNSYLSSSNNGWKTYRSNKTIKAKSIKQSKKIFVNGNLNINLHKSDTKMDFSDYAIYATGNVTIYSKHNDVYLRTLTSHLQIIAGGDITLNGAINQNGISFDAVLIAGGNISINNSTINMSDGFNFNGIIHANENVIIKNRDRNQTSDHMIFSVDKSVLTDLPGQSSDSQIVFSMNPKE